MAFTRFMDMYSGGCRKSQWEYIYIEGNEEDARAIFEERFGRNPDNITCNCCGEDYFVSEYETLEEATYFERRDFLRRGNSLSIDDFFDKYPNVLLIKCNEKCPN